MSALAKRPHHAVAVPIWPGDCPPLPDEEPAFWLLFYGIPRYRFNMIAWDGESSVTGAGIVRAALRRRGLDPDQWWTSFWFIK